MRNPGKRNHNQKIADKATKLFRIGSSFKEILEEMKRENVKTYQGHQIDRNTLQGILSQYCKEWWPLKKEKMRIEFVGKPLCNPSLDPVRIPPGGDHPPEHTDRERTLVQSIAWIVFFYSVFALGFLIGWWFKG